MMKKVFVAMSGGVDSSVTAALMQQAGYDVTGVYMKNWTRDMPGHHCPWQEDYQDAKRVAVQLGLKFKVYDFESDYKSKVVDYMLAEYQAGRTPNPDIMCNQEVKFKLFLNTALSQGADYIATGHYGRVVNAQLWAGVDDNKDQSYFLYRISKPALEKTILPIGDYLKPEIRKLAKTLGLVTADKKDSQGICFVGKVGIKEFLGQYITSQPGDIIDQHGKLVGRHDGAIYYTIGQRQGLHVGGGYPYYVTGKDMPGNIVYVTTDLQDEQLWHKDIRLTDMHWIDEFKFASGLSARTRYRASLVKVKSLKPINDKTWQLQLKDDVRAVTPGQSVVIYDQEHVLGGGIVI